MGRYRVYAEYKDSRVERLGKIPSRWEMWKLSHAYDAIGSGTTPPSENQLFYGGDIPWVTTGELREVTITDTKKKLTPLALASYPTLRLYEPGAVAIAMYGATIGRLGMFGVSATTNQACCVLPSSESLNNRYIFYWLQAFRDEIVQLASGGGQPNINQEIVSSLRVSAPQKDEQTQIAAFLDRETAKIDRLIAKQEALIELLGEKRQAVISNAVTKGLNPNAPMKDSGVEWLGEIPAHWEVSQLRFEAKPGTSITYGIVQAGPNVEDGVPYIRTGDMSGDSLPEQDYPRTSHEIDRAYKRSKVFVGDVVVAIRATVGKCLPVPLHLDGANLTQGTAKVSPGDSLVKDFLLLFMASKNAEQRMGQLAKGATFKEITLDMLRRFVIPKPPKSDQTRIVEVVHGKMGRFDKLIKNAEAAVALLQERRTALISAAVTGKIDVREEVQQ